MRDHRLLAEVLFAHLQQELNPEGAFIFRDPVHSSRTVPLFSVGSFSSIISYPSTFWSWAAQFDTSEGWTPIIMNGCEWDEKYKHEHTYIMMLDNSAASRTYLIIQGVDEKVSQDDLHFTFDFLQIAAAKWQCVRAEKNAALEIKNRDIREAQYLDEIRKREGFVENMQLVQKVALELSNPVSLDDLYKAAVEAVRDQLGFDRAVFMLLDMKKRCFSGTYGTDELGQTNSEHQTQYDIHQLEEEYIEGLFSQNKNLIIIENAPLYTAGKVVGQGWNGMLILREAGEPFGWIAMDNYVNRNSITDYQKQMLESFGALLAQIYIRKRQEQSIRMLHSSIVELSRCATVSEVCQSAVTFAIKHLGIDRLAVFLTDANCTYMQGTWGTDTQGNVVDESYYRSETTDRSIVRQAQSVPNEVAFEESVPVYHDSKIVGFGWTSMTMLTSNSDVPIAFIAADNLLTRSPLTSQLREMMRMFASSLAEVLQRTRAQESIRELNENLEQEVFKRTYELEQVNHQLEIMSKMDPLTRLGNRRMLDYLLEKLCRMESDQDMLFGVMILDIDHFGLFNNRYGHLEGDIALIRIGNILNHHAKGEDQGFCRIGGEEFALLLVDTTDKEVMNKAEAIRRCIESEKISHQDNPDNGYLTVSVGYTTALMSPECFNFDELYNKADQALLKAKKTGRNCVVGHDAPVQPKSIV